MAKKHPPGAGGHDDLADLRRRRAEARHRANSDALRSHAQRQEKARLARAAGSPDPWGEGFAGDGVADWNIDQRDERTGLYALHSSHEQAEDGAPQLREAFLAHLSRVFNTARRELDEDEQLADARAGAPWLSVRQVALVLGVSSATVHRAIAAGYLASHRPGGPFGHHRVSIAALAAYLEACGYTRETAAPIGQRIGRLFSRKATASEN